MVHTAVADHIVATTIDHVASPSTSVLLLPFLDRRRPHARQASTREARVPKLLHSLLHLL
jgi:hypothetical protein